MALNDRQTRFCEEYLIDLNGRQAAIRAGYSKNTAEVQASRMLSKANIQEYIQTKAKKIQNKLEITQERTILEIGRIAFSDPRRFYDEAGNLKNMQDLDEETAATLASVEIEETAIKGEETPMLRKVKKVKLWDKPKGLEMLAKYFKLFEDGPKVTTNINLSALSVEDLEALEAIKKKMS